MDGREYKFLLSMGAIKRLKNRFNVKVISELLQRDAEEIGIPLLYEAMLEKNGMTEQQFGEILPAHLEETIKTVMKLLGISFPESRPTEAAQTPQTQTAATVQ